MAKEASQAASMAHAEIVECEGQYLLALPAIHATGELDESVIDALSWSDIETLSSGCLDRPQRFAAGSFASESQIGGIGSAQRSYSEAQLVWAGSAR